MTTPKRIKYLIETFSKEMIQTKIVCSYSTYAKTHL